MKWDFIYSYFIHVNIYYTECGADILWPHYSLGDFCGFVELYLLNSEEIKVPKFENFVKYYNEEKGISIDKNVIFKHKNLLVFFNNWNIYGGAIFSLHFLIFAQ